MTITSCLIGLVLPGCDTLVTEVTELTIAGHPTAEFGLDTNSVDSGCVPLTVTFIDKSSGPHDEWSWYFGDGDSSNDTNPTHTYDSAGTYTVTLFIRNYEGIDEEPGVDNEVKKRFIIVGTTINSFTASPTVGCQGMEVTFAPIDYGGITDFSWNFGDGGVSSDSNPTHPYDTAGVYSCTLTVTGECGTKVIGYDSLITINACPIARIWADPLYGCHPLTVTFIDSTDYQGAEETTISRDWRFAGDSANTDSFQYIFEEPGRYIVTLTASSEGGVSTDTLDDTIVVWGSAFATITANGAVALIQGCLDSLWLFFVDFEAAIPESVIIESFDSLVWDFGDGKRSNPNDSIPVKVSHPYDSAGEYTIRLFSYGECNADTAIEHSVEKMVCVSWPFDTSLAGFTVGPDADTAAGIQGYTSDLFTFTDTTPGGMLGRTWNFGETSQTDTNRVVTYQYADTGTYTATLVVGNCCTSSDTIKQTIVIDTMGAWGTFRRYRDETVKH